MCFQVFKTNSFSIGGRHPFPTTNIAGNTTSKVNEVIFGPFLKYYRKKIVTVSDNTIPTEGLVNCFKAPGEKWFIASKMISKNVFTKTCQGCGNCCKGW